MAVRGTYAHDGYLAVVRRKSYGWGLVSMWIHGIQLLPCPGSSNSFMVPLDCISTQSWPTQDPGSGKMIGKAWKWAEIASTQFLGQQESGRAKVGWDAGRGLMTWVWEYIWNGAF